MANIVLTSRGFIEVSLDGYTDFDSRVELGRAIPSGLRIRSIRFNPSALGDDIVVRDGPLGPGIFRMPNCLGDWDVGVEYYGQDVMKGDLGRVMTPYIYGDEMNVAVENGAYITFEY